MSVLHWNKVDKVMSVEAWKSISADGAPPGVYTPNMSKTDMLKWKAKLIMGSDPRVEIRKTFHWNNGLSYPHCKNYASQALIVVRDGINTNEPVILISTNGKMGMSYKESQDFNTAIKEAYSVLNRVVKKEYKD